ncbi:MAG TPA: DUF4424 family protein [Candidatus Acidoferrum sp.]|nr:DUF4424 family protein [Candidatus Acidoferrum sp.]
MPWRWQWSVINNISGGGEMSLGMRNRLSYHVVFLSLCVSLLSFAPRSVADDAAVSVKAGGIEFKHEPRISMEKEVLRISREKVAVEYQFLNESVQDITTELAFPVPPMGVFDSDCGPRSTFNDFRLWVDGQEIHYETEDLAKLAGTDYTLLIRNLGINIATFGDYWGPAEKCDGGDFKLSTQQVRELASHGLLDKDGVPQWTVNRLFHWTQKFPARKTILIRHEYRPVIGSQYALLKDLEPGANQRQTLAAREASRAGQDKKFELGMLEPIQNACLEPGLLKALNKDNAVAFPTETARAVANNYVDTIWVDFVIKTANFWKTPIKEFELIVEKPEPSFGKSWYVSFCWNGEIHRDGSGRFVAKAKNFVPQRDLTVMFLRMHPRESMSILN